MCPSVMLEDHEPLWNSVDISLIVCEPQNLRLHKQNKNNSIKKQLKS